MFSRKELGKQGENLAEKYLRKNGYKILERNFSCKVGEIDIVAKEGNTLVFVEVKTRTSEDYGDPVEAVRPWKLRKVKKAGTFYKLNHPELPDALRIDVVTVELDTLESPAKIQLFKNVLVDGI